MGKMTSRRCLGFWRDLGSSSSAGFLPSLLIHLSLLSPPLCGVEAGNSVVHRVRQYNPNCLLLTGEEAEECEAAKISGQLDGVPWWTWLLLGIVLLLILLVLARAFCSWNSSSQPAEKRIRRSCSREVKREERLLSRREEDEVNSCYVPAPPMLSQPRMSWQGSPLPRTEENKFLFPECPAIRGNASNVKTLSEEKGFVPISPNVCNPRSVEEDVDPKMCSIPVEVGQGSRNSVYV